jgi:hypothetical protein
VPLTKFVLRMVHNLADLVLVTSPQLKEELAGFGIKRLAVWKKGIDTEVRAVSCVFRLLHCPVCPRTCLSVV